MAQFTLADLAAGYLFFTLNFVLRSSASWLFSPS
jgi:hypothetical protein